MKKLVGFDPVTGAPKYEEVVDTNNVNSNTEAPETVNIAEETANVNLQKNTETPEVVNVAEETVNVNLQKNTETPEVVNVAEKTANVNLQKNAETPEVVNVAEETASVNLQKAAETEISNSQNFQPQPTTPVQGGFDPMTGKPLGQNSAPAQGGFDPMTGKPLGQNSAPAQGGFDPMTGMPITQANAAPKKKKSKTPIIVVVSLLLIVALGAAAYFSGLFRSNTEKVIMAISNTMNQKSNMVKALENLNILESDSFVANMNMNVEGVKAEFEFVKKDSDKQISATVSGGGINNIDLVAGITDSELKFEMPDVSDYLFVYNYKKEKDGYLTDIAGEEDIEALDKAAEYIYSSENYNKFRKDIKKIALDNIKKIEVKTIKDKEFEIDGKDRNCKGYKATITGDDIENIIKDIEEYVEKEYSELYDQSGLEKELGDFYDELKEMEDIDFKFYIYKNQLACVSISVDKDEVSILFTGCKKGMHNIEIQDNGKTVLELEGEVDGSEETYTFLENGKEVFVVEYDSKSGDFELSSGTSYVIEGNLKPGSKEFALSLDKISMGSYYSVEDVFEMSIKSGGSMKKYEGETFDVGNASAEEFKEVIEDIDYEALGYSSYESFVRDLMY